MAVMLVDLPPAQAPASATPGRWVHVSSPRPVADRPAASPSARPASSPRPGGRPGGVAAPRVVSRGSVGAVSSAATAMAPASAPLRLTRRGLAVVMGGFALVMITALVVLVTAFLAVPNEPVVSQLLLG